MKKIIIILFCIVFFLATKDLLPTEVYLDISRGFAKKIPVALSISGDKDEKTKKILVSDLQRSGLFSPLINDDENEAELLIKLNCSLKLGLFRLEGIVRNINTGSGFVFGKRYQGKYPLMRNIIHSFTNDFVKKITGEKGIALTKICFISDESGAKEVYLVDYDGQNKKRVTSDKIIAACPDWSEDGKNLVYLSYLNNRTEIFFHNIKSNSRKILCSYPGLNAFAAISKRGEIALTLSKDGDPEIYVMQKNGSHLRRLTYSKGIDASPSWAPDGKKIAFVSDRSGSPQIYILDLSTKKVRRITYQGSYNTSPAWAPEGNLIAYTSKREGCFEICIINPDNGEFKAITSGPGSKEDPSWAPNGRQLVFSKKLRYKSNLYILDICTEKNYPLITGKGNYISPAWSPK